MQAPPQPPIGLLAFYLPFKILDPPLMIYSIVVFMYMLLANSKSKLEDLHQDLTTTLDKVATREKYMNIQLDSTLKDFRVSRERHAEVRGKYEVGMQRVNELTQSLNVITDELEGVKIRMDEHGTNMTDATPVVRIKHSLQRIKTENTQMDMRIGVLQHLLTSSKLKEKSMMQESAPEGPGLQTFDLAY